MSFEQILEILGVEICGFYETNLKDLNFERFVPYSLKKYFLKIENEIIYRLLWKGSSKIFQVGL